MSTPSTSSVRRSLRCINTPVKYNENERTPTKRRHYNDSPPVGFTDTDDSDEKGSAYPSADIISAESMPRHSVLFGDEDVAGSHVYSFKTPKKKDAMATIAAITPKTPKLAAAQTPKTPKSAAKTPTSTVAKRSLADSLNSKTPSHIRVATKIGNLPRLA